MKLKGPYLSKGNCKQNSTPLRKSTSMVLLKHKKNYGIAVCWSGKGQEQVVGSCEFGVTFGFHEMLGKYRAA
jgi:hypothetical protein